MGDDELAEGILSTGINWIPAIIQLPNKNFARDTRVAMGMVKKCDAVYIQALLDGGWEVEAMFNCESMAAKGSHLERTINEACVLAMRN